MDFKYYLYQHVRLDDNSVFYIGIGTKKEKHAKKPKSEYSRAFAKCKYSRTKFWHNIVSKTDYRVEILMESDDYEVVKKLEVALVAHYGRKNLGKGNLVNLTDGGDGNSGAIVSKETSEKISKSNTGKKRTPEVRKAKSEAMSGGKHINAKIVLSLYMGIYYDTIDYAAKAHGIATSTLSDKLNGKRTNNTGLVFADNEGIYPKEPFIGEPYVPEKLPESIVKYKKTMRERGHFDKTLLLHQETGIFYMSIAEASIALGINQSILARKLKGTLKNNTSLIKI